MEIASSQSGDISVIDRKMYLDSIDTVFRFSASKAILISRSISGTNKQNMSVDSMDQLFRLNYLELRHTLKERVENRQENMSQQYQQQCKKLYLNSCETFRTKQEIIRVSVNSKRKLFQRRYPSLYLRFFIL